MIFWDGRTPDGQRVRWGPDGLDPILAGETDLSRCAAIREPVLARLIQRRAVPSASERDRALPILLRSAGVTAVRVSGLTGAFDETRPGPLGGGLGPASTTERLTLALVVRPEWLDIEPFLAALHRQALSSTLDLLLVGAGLETADLRRVVHTAEIWTQAAQLRLRRHAFGAEVPANYLHNSVVALSPAEIVVFADPRAIPRTPALLQTLADWAASGDVAAACPRMEHASSLLSAGLGLNDEGALGVERRAPLSRRLRLAAAPSPWLFAAGRRLWLESGGLRAQARTAAWTRDFAVVGGPAGRTLYVGHESAEWIDPEAPTGLGIEEALARPRQAHAGLALTRAAPVAAVAQAPASKPTGAGPAKPAQVPAPEPPALPYALDDPPSPSALRLLVFADAFGASQAIAFEHGLAEARAAGRIAVRIVEEGAFGGDGRTLAASPVDDKVEAAFAARPDVVIASRLGHADVWGAVRRAAERRGTALVFHLDDDLFDLPLSAGIERYRLARAPRRLASLQEALDCADLTLAATPALADSLRSRTRHSRIYALESGVGGAPGRRRTGRTDGRIRVGYMGSASHDADLAAIVPAVNAVLDAAPEVDVELFGSIAKQPSAALLARVRARHPGITGDYAAFKAKLASLDWDIGLAPLRGMAFNRVKTATKWVEYAEAGVAVLASAIDPYDAMGQAGAALTVDDDGWRWGLQRLVSDARLRHSLTLGADELLARRYGWAALQAQIESALTQAVALSRARRPAKVRA